MTFLLPCFFTSPALAVNPENVGIQETAPTTVDNAPTPMSEGFNKDLNVGIISEYGWDLWNTLYAEANYSLQLTENLAFSLSGQYTDQRSVGENLAGPEGTGHYG